MERVEIREVNSPLATGLQISAEPYLTALTERYAERGLARAAQKSAEEQMLREQGTVELDPDAYRLSGLSEAAITGRYRHGKELMNTADLIGYFSETRERRIQNADLTQNTGMESCEVEESEGQALTATEQALTVRERLGEELRSLPVRIKEGLPVWFNTARADTSNEKKRFPFSALASIVAIAASLMLIITGAIMVTSAEEDLSLLQREVDLLENEVAEVRSDMNVENDLLEIRRIAMEEYGMVEEEYVKMDYVSVRADDEVESFESDRSDKIGLDALLSAIGIKNRP